MLERELFIKIYIFFWEDIFWVVELLNKRGRSYTLFIFRQKITSWACLGGSGLKYIFHLLAQGLTLSRSLFSFCKVLIGSRTTENIEVSSSKSFTLDSRLSNKQWTKNWTLRNTSFDCQPFKFLSIQNNSLLSFEKKKIHSVKARRSPFTFMHFILQISPSCQSRSKALDISKKTPQTSNEGLEYILLVTEKSWCIQESPAMKPDWFGLSNLFTVKRWKIVSKMIFSNSLIQIVKREAAQ